MYSVSSIGSTGAALTAPQYRYEGSPAQPYCTTIVPLYQASTDSLRETASQLSDAHLIPERQTTPTYPGLTVQAVLIRTIPIILGNLFCEALFAYTLKHYNDKGVLRKVDRRWFNTISLLLAAALSMGIGYFLDQVGLMLRGGIVMKSANTKTEISHIWRGTIGSYILLVWSHLRRKSYNVVTTLAWLFVVGNVIGRLSVAFLGLTYNVDDEEFVEVKALEGTWWPEIGEKFANDSTHCWNSFEKLQARPHLQKNTSLAVTDSGELDLEYFLNVPDLTLSIDDQGTSSTVSYSYTLKDKGGDEHMRMNRTIQVLANCTQVRVHDLFNPLNYSLSTFYPIRVDEIYQGIDDWGNLNFTQELGGWIMFSHSRNREGCGPTCTMLGLAEGNTYETSLSPNIYRPGYNCELTVAYYSPATWGNRARVAPSDSLLLSLSRFLVSNETRDDLAASTFTNGSNVAKDRIWLPQFRNASLHGNPSAPSVGIAGVLARSVALVVQRMGNGLRKEEIISSQISAVGIFSVDWYRVIAILAGIAVFQMLVAILTGWFVLATLKVGDDIEMAYGILANIDKQDACGQPWVLVRVDGKGRPTYLFTGVVRARKT
ncbi:hypothetical protein BDZ91DRAFT_831717 [Kalaharituber pfeilii]|nr:hypothetical protein BDZ91DRAFT_831717 [Kalaharituber pfeilii]